MASNNQGARPMDTLDYLKIWWDGCPLFTKSMIYICTTFWILEVFLPQFAGWLPNIPYRTIMLFEFHRLFFSAFFNQGLLGLIFGFLVFLPIASKKEREWGTIKTIFDFFYKNFIINLTFVLICWGISTFYKSILNSPCYGLWPISFYYIVERCLLDPNGVSQVFCFPVYIRNLLYPIILFLLFSLFSQMILYDLAVSILVGFVHFKFLDNCYHSVLSERRCSRWESNILFSWLRKLPNYVSPSGNMFSNRSAQQPVGSYGDNNASAPIPSQSSGFAAFKGKGVTLGGTDEQPMYIAPPVPPQQGDSNYYQQMNDSNRDPEGGRR